jgi:hypothetical protein
MLEDKETERQGGARGHKTTSVYGGPRRLCAIDGVPSCISGIVLAGEGKESKLAIRSRLLLAIRSSFLLF